MTRAEFLALARTWVGTPYHDQARLKGVGADCIGFIIGVAQEATGRDIVAPTDYGRYPVPARALRALMASGEVDEIPRDTARPGDILYLRIHDLPQHFGLLDEGDTFLHCTEGVGVVRVDFAEHLKRRVRYAFAIRWLTDGAGQ